MLSTCAHITHALRGPGEGPGTHQAGRPAVMLAQVITFVTPFATKQPDHHLHFLTCHVLALTSWYSGFFVGLLLSFSKFK